MHISWMFEMCVLYVQFYVPTNHNYFLVYVSVRIWWFERRHTMVISAALFIQSDKVRGRVLEGGGNYPHEVTIMNNIRILWFMIGTCSQVELNSQGR